MENNIGSVDKVLRILVGLVLIVLVFVGPQTVWGWVGVPVILIALFGWCPLYKVLGISSCKKCAAE
ncbi:YgaP family membrane protein [Amphritea sp. HPY]|uniref:YgaP family membrane protein n=1 Tax=Amphritea sp. HPY TaxID=3421652 RepID=UPI003D7E42E4